MAKDFKLKDIQNQEVNSAKMMKKSSNYLCAIFAGLAAGKQFMI